MGMSEGGVTNPAEQAPTFTLTAENYFDILAMVTIASLLDTAGAGDWLGYDMRRDSKTRRAAARLSPERLIEMRDKLREFELWEEAHHR